MQNTYETATGKIDYRLTNDIMFRLVLERNQIVLNELVRSLLHLRPDDTVNAVIQNPVSLGEDVRDKTFVLDVKILLNGTDIINIEMQVINGNNWSDRSLSYLCRTFDNLMRGSDYSATATVIHISILDFTLFPDYPEFYAHYRLMNVKNHQIYNDKFRLNVLCLEQINGATVEDRDAGLDQWAALFRATTWEDIKMLAQQNPAFQETARELYRVNADSAARAQAEAHEEYMRLERYNKRRMEDVQRKLAEAQDKLQEFEKVQGKLQELKEAQQALAESTQTIAALKEQVAQLQEQLAAKES